MTRTLAFIVLAFGSTSPAWAQEWTVDAQLTTALGFIEEENGLAPAADSPLLDGSLAVMRSDVFENGLTLAWRGELRLQRDAASRPAFAGVLGGCDPVFAGCASLRDGVSVLSPISPSTGLASAGQLEDEDIFAALEGASVSLSGGWGEGVIGLDSGAAARLDARAPTVLNRVSAFTPGLDPTGAVMTRARNDVTGPSFKATYMTPRLLGIRLGASYTPKADERGVDFDPRPAGSGLAGAELEDVWEGAASFARRFPASGIRVRAALTASYGASGSRFAGFGDYEAWGAGLELERAGWTGGVRWLASNNAWAGGNGDYEAVELGLVHQGERWRIGAEAGWADDDLGRVDGSSLLVGVSRKINDNLDMGVAYASATTDLPVVGQAGFGHINASNGGLIFELTVRNK